MAVQRFGTTHMEEKIEIPKITLDGKSVLITGGGMGIAYTLACGCRCRRFQQNES